MGGRVKNENGPFGRMCRYTHPKVFGTAWILIKKCFAKLKNWLTQKGFKKFDFSGVATNALNFLRSFTAHLKDGLHSDWH